MGNLTSSKGFPLQLDRDIVDMFYERFASRPPEWSRVFKKTKFPKGADYVSADIAGIGGTLKASAEGEAVTYATGSEGFKVTRTPLFFQLGFQVTEIALEDELFDKIRQLPQSLAKTAQNTYETYCWDYVNKLATASLGKDGLYVAIATHATLKGTTINNLGAADLADASLKAAFEYFQKLIDEDDLPIQMFLKTLVVPIANQWKANELLKSYGRVWDYTGTGGNEAKGLVGDGTNAHTASDTAMNLLSPSANVVNSWDVMATRWMTDDDSWLALGDEHDLQCMVKRPVRMQSADDPATGNRLYRCSTRFRPFANEYRGIYFSPGA